MAAHVKPVVVDLKTVIDYWVQQYEPTDPTHHIINRVWYLDPAKGKVVVILTTESP